MAFDKLKNFMNADIKDGVRGQAHLQSVSQPTESGTSGNCRMWLDVYVEGWEPYRLKHHCMVKMTKWPSPGETLPVMVDREIKERIDILWDEVKTVDELMSEGAPGQAPGQVTVNMGEPQVIDLSGAGAAGAAGAAGMPGIPPGSIPPGMEEQVRQAMEMAQQMMGQMAQMQGNQVPPGVPPTTGAVPPTPQPPAPPGADPQVEELAESTGNMVLDRIAQLERLAKLRDEGVLTDSEFEAEKAKVLGA